MSKSTKAKPTGLSRLRKFFHDHVFRVEHDWELKMSLPGFENKWPAADHRLEFFPILTADDPRLNDVARDFPKQSGAFPRNFADGCILLCAGQGTRVMGYFVVARRDFFDRDEFRVTFPASDQLGYAFNFFVANEHRSLPVARVLLNEGFKWLEAKGFKEIYAMCSARNRPLVRFYKQAGMEPTGRALDCYVTKIKTYPKWTAKRDVAPLPWLKR